MSSSATAREPMQFEQQVTFLGCCSLIETARFYEDILGLALVLDQGLRR